MYYCEKCNFTSNVKCNWEKHITPQKHIIIQKNNNNINIFSCNCGKTYKYSQGLTKHKKTCNPTQTSETEEPSDKELIMMLIKENSELKHLVLDVCQKIQPLNNTVNSHNVTNNKTFNLQVFLNETCKDAMNIMDFVDSLKIQLSDLENVGKLGFVNGISNIIVKNLNSMDETMRPVHCTDTKREVMYVKDENKWEKENENKQKLRKAIKGVVRKNSKLLNDFRDKHPDCIKSDSRYSDQYNKIIVEAFGGKGDNDLEKEDKIIRNIAKQVVIDKS